MTDRRTLAVKFLCKLFGHRPKHIVVVTGRVYGNTSICKRCGRRIKDIYPGLLGWYES